MSKLGCICGHTIADQTDNISYKAIFLRDQDWEDYYNCTDDISSFIDAIQNGKRTKWIKNFFSEEYPTDISNSSVVFDIIRQRRNLEGAIYQCENCGRIKIQVQDTNVYSSFHPEDDRNKDIFKRFRQTKNAG